MTVSSTTNRKTFTGDAVTTSFGTSPVVFFDTSDLVIYVVVTATGVAETLVENTDYTVTGGDGSTGTVNLAGGTSPYGAPAATQKLVILRVLPLTQADDFVNNDIHDAEVLEDNLDKITMLLQQHDDVIGRSITIPDSDVAGTTTELPVAASRANMLLSFDSDGDVTVTAPSSGTAADVTTNLANTSDAAKGDALIGVKSTLSNATSTTQHQVNSETVSVFRFYSTAQIADVIANTGLVDITAATNYALASGAYIEFPPGTYYSATGLTVPVTCAGIFSKGANLLGPGTSTYDGFTFTDRYADDSGTINVTGCRFHLPNINNFKRAIRLVDASWVYAHCDLIESCNEGINLETTVADYCVENDFRIGMITLCDKALSFTVPATTGAPTEGVQGCRFDVEYISGCNYGIYGDFTATSDFTYNEFNISELDGNGASGGASSAYAIYFDANSTGNTANTYRIPTGPINTITAPFFNTGVDGTSYQRFETLFFTGHTSTPTNFGNWLGRGVRTTVDPGVTLTVYVATTGNDTTGKGSSTAPFLTIQKAINSVQQLDSLGGNVLISVAAGTYAGAVAYTSTGGLSCNGKIIVRGTATPSDVTISGGITCSGNGSIMSVESLTITTVGMTSSYGGQLYWSTVTFGTLTGVNAVAATSNGIAQASGIYTVTGSMAAFAKATFGGQVILGAYAATISGTPAWADAFAYALTGGIIAGTGFTFSGAGSTGARYSSVQNSIIDTAGGGANFFPGNGAGSTATGGIYI